MNWEVIRIVIDFFSVIMGIIFFVVLYIAYKSYKNVSGPIKMMGGMFKPMKEDVKDMSSKQDEDNSLISNTSNVQTFI